ncbi:PTS system D-fructose-specific IIA component (F1P-forming), Frc family [Olsenella uli DSM 7084]|uniref:PTS system D-fructose-specific IIA component (F1P-forming), Frc family n=1 Tax=Olsenella uli (strain ATCC 49627 / DSM 7084 / CCUG 31166 / CIP 109912 / JCM 12494 / LMG 11480 / NCIMB 702895 / VPI D76D-27C) TaxID=633147 RepID=E1QZ36_OLSUV|nr:fructose PTS transporter subunit IIA [Olsenella uli]ADK67650.1 PTS system D-fructose-specific IIA component (F1P-forming), Frc family [Olsenella uli DSM 7084]KRO13559.1 PTS system D-fructose-specific IIA component (F1P-forming), Frc family [Olsenella uli DSM 7084]
MSDFVQASHVFLDNPAKTVDEALAFLSAQAVALGIAEDERAVLDAFKAREAEGTTGMMEGFAIPHAKSEAIKQASVMVVKFAGDVEWESMDGKPIRVAIALCVPGGEAGTTHLQLLSKVAVMLMDEKFRNETLADVDTASIAARINSGLD